MTTINKHREPKDKKSYGAMSFILRLARLCVAEVLGDRYARVTDVHTSLENL